MLHRVRLLIRGVQFFLILGLPAVLSFAQTRKRGGLGSTSKHLPPPRQNLTLRNSKQISLPSEAVEDDIDKFRKDIGSVFALRAEDYDSQVSALHQSRAYTTTKVWSEELWTKHTSRWRYARHLRDTLWSRLMIRIFPQLHCLILWSAFAASKSGSGHPIVSNLSMPMTSLSLISTFLGFLLTLRTNQGLNRLAQGREAWGRVVIVSRETAQLLATYVFPQDRNLGLLAARNLALFGWLTKSHLRQRVEDEDDVVRAILPDSPDVEFILSHRKRPAAVIARIRQILADTSQRGLLSVPEHQALENNLAELNAAFGICERIRGSCIPPLYTSHTSRLLICYLFFLPLELANLMSPLLTVLATSFVGYAMLGLDEISFTFEQPFRLMPLKALSKMVTLDVSDAFILPPPPLRAGV